MGRGVQMSSETSRKNGSEDQTLEYQAGPDVVAEVRGMDWDIIQRSAQEAYYKTEEGQRLVLVDTHRGRLREKGKTYHLNYIESGANAERITLAESDERDEMEEMINDLLQ